MLIKANISQTKAVMRAEHVAVAVKPSELN